MLKRSLQTKQGGNKMTPNEVEQQAVQLPSLEWREIADTSWQIMQNGTNELFIKFDNKEIRLTPAFNGFHITDYFDILYFYEIHIDPEMDIEYEEGDFEI